MQPGEIDSVVWRRSMDPVSFARERCMVRVLPWNGRFDGVKQTSTADV